jgi:hypothetical protein
MTVTLITQFYDGLCNLRITEFHEVETLLLSETACGALNLSIVNTRLAQIYMM